MIDAKDIEICPDPDCECCATTRRLMEVLGPAVDLNDEEASERCTAITHALARTLYAHFRSTGKLGDTVLAAEMVSFFAHKTMGALARCWGNDETRVQ